MRWRASIGMVALGFLLLTNGCGGESAGTSSTTFATVPGSAPTTTSTMPGPDATDSTVTTTVAPDDLAGRVAAAEPGSILELPPGEYRLNAQLVVDKALTLSGAGSDQTVILSTASPAVLRFEGSGPFELSDLTVRYSGEGPSTGIAVVGGGFASSNLVVTGAVRVEHEPGSGSGIIFSNDSHGDVNATEISDNGSVGIWILDTADVTIAGSRITRNGVGVAIADEGGGHIIHSAVADNNGTGVWVQGGEMTVDDSDVTGNKEVGLSAAGTAVIRMGDCRVSGNGGMGVIFLDDASGEVSGCTVEFNSHGGIGVAASAHIEIVDSTVSANISHGIEVTDSATLLIRATSVSGNGHAGILLLRDSVAEIRACTIADNGSNGIQVTHRAAIDVIGSTISGHGRLGDELRHWGIAVVGTVGTSIRRSEIFGNEGGIGIPAGQEATMSGNDLHDNEWDIESNVDFPEITETGVVTSTTIPAATTTVPDLGASLPPGTPYESYGWATNDIGNIALILPDAWAERRSGPFSHQGQPVGFSLTAASDVDAFIAGWGIPGVFIGAAADLDLTVEEYIDLYDLSGDCTFRRRVPYEDVAYRGLFDSWLDCGDSGSLLEILVVESKHHGGIVVLQLISVTQADRTAVEQILATFGVEFD